MAFDAQSLIRGNLFGWIIRGLQLAFSAISLGVSLDSTGIFSDHVSIGWFFIVSIISLAYLGLLGIFTFSLPKYIIPGYLIIIESIVTFFLITAFIALAVDLSAITADCSKHNEGTCASAKAAIAFGLLNFLLFTLTTIIFGLNVINPINHLVKNRLDIWFPIKNINLELNKPVLALKTTKFDAKEKTDIEAVQNTNTVNNDSSIPTITNENIEDVQNTNTVENIFDDAQNSNTVNNDAHIGTTTNEESAVKTNI